MFRPASIPPSPPRPTRWGLALGLCWALLTAGCGPRAPESVELLSDPVRVVATQAFDDELGVYKIRVAQGDRDWTIRCLVPRAGRSGGPDAAAITATLHERVAWKPPYLFVREAHGDRKGWRSTVDHVFKVGTNALTRVGTVAAEAGAPGSQYQDGKFRDLYDRLEFTFLTSRAEAPRFTLVMREHQGRFEVDLADTWQAGEAVFRDALRELERLATRPEQRQTERDQRRVRGLALLSLALARYCGRESEFESALAAAKPVVEELDPLLTEVATIRTGELAPSSEEVFRANPALINLFREAPPPGETKVPDGLGPPPSPTGIGLQPL